MKATVALTTFSMRLIACCMVAGIMQLNTANGQKTVGKAREKKAELPAPSANLLGLVDTGWRVSEVVLSHHVNPPTRQQMFLRGINAVAATAKTSDAAAVKSLQQLLDKPAQQ